MPNSHRVAVAQLHDWQIFGLDFDDSDVRFLVSADDLRRKFAAVFQFHVDLIGGLDHVKVRENVAIGPNDKSGTFALDRLKISRVSARITFVRRALKEQVLERGGFVIVLL